MNSTQKQAANITPAPAALADYTQQLSAMVTVFDRTTFAIGHIGYLLDALAVMPIRDPHARKEISEALAMYQAWQHTVHGCNGFFIDREDPEDPEFTDPEGVIGWDPSAARTQVTA